MNIEDKKDVLACLISLKFKIPSRSLGICGNVDIVATANKQYYAFLEYFNDIWRGWPKFSGDNSFPVSSPSYVNSFETYMNHADYWDLASVYGRNRYELLEYLINFIQNDIESECLTNVPNSSV